MIDIIERTRKGFNLPPIKYAFFNTGLEMKATKDHVKEIAEKYKVEITEYQPVNGYIIAKNNRETIKIPCKSALNVVLAVRKYGQPFISKQISEGLYRMQKQGIPVEVYEEYEFAQDKKRQFEELVQQYPGRKWTIRFLIGCDSHGNPQTGQGYITAQEYLREFIKDNPPEFRVSSKCCDYCKKNISHKINRLAGYEMFITGERKSEGGSRAIGNLGCFQEMSDGTFKMRPLYYVSDEDKAWYKEHYGIKYSDAYEVYGLTRTGCCGCAISYKAVDDLELIRPYEPNVVKAAWNIFGDSYRYRQKYNEYKANRKEAEKIHKDDEIEGQINIADYLQEIG